MTFEELKARVTADGVSDAEAGVLVNQRYQQLVTQAKFLEKLVTLDATSTTESVYAFPDNEVVQIEYIYIGTTRYDRVGLDELHEVESGRAFLDDWRYGIVSPYFNEDGDAQFKLYPPPSEGDQNIIGVIADTPAALESPDDSPITPVDFDQYIIDGARALIYDEEDEDGGNRDRLEAKFERGVALLQGRKNTRLGRGPTQARIHGVHRR